MSAWSHQLTRKVVLEPDQVITFDERLCRQEFFYFYFFAQFI